MKMWKIENEVAIGGCKKKKKKQKLRLQLNYLGFSVYPLVPTKSRTNRGKLFAWLGFILAQL